MNTDKYLQFEDTLIYNEKDYDINQKLIKGEEIYIKLDMIKT